MDEVQNCNINKKRNNFCSFTRCATCCNCKSKKCKKSKQVQEFLDLMKKFVTDMVSPLEKKIDDVSKMISPKMSFQAQMNGLAGYQVSAAFFDTVVYDSTDGIITLDTDPIFPTVQQVGKLKSKEIITYCPSIINSDNGVIDFSQKIDVIDNDVKLLETDKQEIVIEQSSSGSLNTDTGVFTINEPSTWLVEWQIAYTDVGNKSYTPAFGLLVDNFDEEVDPNNIICRVMNSSQIGQISGSAIINCPYDKTRVFLIGLIVTVILPKEQVVDIPFANITFTRV